MRRRAVLALLGLLVACGAGSATPTPPSAVTNAPLAASASPRLALPRFPMPSPLPARYLRTLEYDPGGYDATSPPGGPTRGEASDLLLGDLLYHSPSTLGPRAQALGISCQTCHPNGAAHTTFLLEGLSDHP